MDEQAAEQAAIVRVYAVHSSIADLDNGYRRPPGLWVEVDAGWRHGQRYLKRERILEDERVCSPEQLNALIEQAAARLLTVAEAGVAIPG